MSLIFSEYLSSNNLKFAEREKITSHDHQTDSTRKTNNYRMALTFVDIIKFPRVPMLLEIIDMK